MHTSPPNNPELEQRCLSVLMLDPDGVRQCVAAGLTAGDFYLPLHGRLFQAICACAVDGQVDPVAVWRAVNGAEGERIEVSTILAIAALEPTTIRVKQFAGDIIALSRQRKTMDLLAEAQETVSKHTGSWAEAWEQVHPIIAKINDVGVVPAPRTTSSMIEEAAEMVRNPMAGAMAGRSPVSRQDRAGAGVRSQGSERRQTCRDLLLGNARTLIARSHGTHGGQSGGFNQGAGGLGGFAAQPAAYF